ncbi:hypothetical protein BDN70DRAFT_870996 [Pholiota conissans]|uniref:Uncharacterized protein n=1 Tax=Pholiota conissans TaxID=109636 RepID=A0A9P6D7B7_9AGAR|nr:hypothetical protein BDN70DRAFT_870996 [Pholiota conissans]
MNIWMLRRSFSYLRDFRNFPCSFAVRDLALTLRLALLVTRRWHLPNQISLLVSSGVSDSATGYYNGFDSVSVDASRHINTERGKEPDVIGELSDDDGEWEESRSWVRVNKTHRFRESSKTHQNTRTL